MNKVRVVVGLIPAFAIFMVSGQFSAFALSAPPVSRSVTLAWEPSIDPGVSGYAVYIGNSSGIFLARMDVGNQYRATISGLSEKLDYYFVAIAYTPDGVESLPSNEAVLLAPKITGLSNPSGNVPVKIDFIASLQKTQLQASEDLVHWTTLLETSNVTSQSMLFTDTDSASSGSRFYRLVFQ